MATTTIRATLAIVALIALNVAAHFVPFERAALAPDDYAALVRAQSITTDNALEKILRYPHPPLH